MGTVLLMVQRKRYWKIWTSHWRVMSRCQSEECDNIRRLLTCHFSEFCWEHNAFSWKCSLTLEISSSVFCMREMRHFGDPLMTFINSYQRTRWLRLGKEVEVAPSTIVVPSLCIAARDHECTSLIIVGMWPYTVLWILWILLAAKFRWSF